MLWQARSKDEARPLIVIIGLLITVNLSKLGSARLRVDRCFRRAANDCLNEYSKPSRRLVGHSWGSVARVGFIRLCSFGSGAMWGGLVEAPPFTFSRICQNKTKPNKNTHYPLDGQLLIGSGSCQGTPRSGVTDNAEATQLSMHTLACAWWAGWPPGKYVFTFVSVIYSSYFF